MRTGVGGCVGSWEMVMTAGPVVGIVRGGGEDGGGGWEGRIVARARRLMGKRMGGGGRCWAGGWWDEGVESGREFKFFQFEVVILAGVLERAEGSIPKRRLKSFQTVLYQGTVRYV